MPCTPAGEDPSAWNTLIHQGPVSSSFFSTKLPPYLLLVGKVPSRLSPFWTYSSHSRYYSVWNCPFLYVSPLPDIFIFIFLVIGILLLFLVTQLCPTLGDPMDCSMLGFPVLHYLPGLLKLRSIASMMPSNHPILYHSLLLLSSIFLSIRVFSNESVLHIRFSSVAQSCPTLGDPMDCSTPGLHIHHQLLEFTQTHVHWIGGAIQPSHPLSCPFPPAFNLSQHQGLFQGVSSSHQVAKALEFQLQQQSFQQIFRTDLL